MGKCIDCGADVDKRSLRCYTCRGKSIRTDITGKKFGRLTALEYVKSIKYLNGARPQYWKFICDCGQESIIYKFNVIRGLTTSCGCYLKEVRGKSKITHGLAKSRFYRIYVHIVDRCRRPKDKNFKNYGGRGIKCLFNNFEHFRDTMYESYLKHCEQFGIKNTTIERNNVNGNYEPSNLSFATWKEQQRNRQYNRIIEYNGQKYPLAQWSEITGIKQEVIRARIDSYNWSVEEALNTPVKFLSKRT